MIREATIDDAAAASELLSVVTPEFMASAATIRHAMTTTRPEARRRWWCAHEDGELVGWSSLGLVTETSEPGAAWFGLSVHPEHRGRGIGAQLAAAAEEHAREIGARRVHAWSRGDEGSTGFTRGRGFTQTGSHDILVVDPRTTPQPEGPPGVELLPFAAFTHDPEPVYHVDTVSMMDEPGELTLDRWELDVWIEHFWNHPLLDREASIVAVVEGVPTTMTFLHTDRSRGRGMNQGTGTLPDYRGRGLALLAKRASLARGAELGITAVYTGNDVTNAPMQAINRRLGYTVATTFCDWVLDLTT